jgi:hypothetical protein
MMDQGEVLTYETPGATSQDCGTHNYVRHWKHILQRANWLQANDRVDETWVKCRMTVVVQLLDARHLQNY